jgi:hypothetical protein
VVPVNAYALVLNEQTGTPSAMRHVLRKKRGRITGVARKMLWGAKNVVPHAAGL